MSGALTFDDYKKLISEKKLFSKNKKKIIIQPSSVDLSLSNECYEISSSFLSPYKSVRNKLQNLIIKKIDLSKKYIFKKNKTYIVKINEELRLENDICGFCNPKSSTGRLDIFCRVILDNCNQYEKIPKNYKGEIFIEITTRSFDIELIQGDTLNQMRLAFKKNQYVSDNVLKKMQKKKSFVFDENNLVIKPFFRNGLEVSVDLSEKNKINAYVAKKNTPVLIFRKKKYHKIIDFWQPVKSNQNSLIIKKNKFYILKSKEKIRIPNNMAGEMIPYDTGLGDFRVHYAGFFDPGFGELNGTFAVLEVKTNEVSFLLEDCQTIARIKYEKLNKNCSVVYGSSIKSNYHNQSLTLSKHFIY
tara:strand:+ start:32000 stop:33073 length:1074 start_codon:yes stop_codon:yes gene_type:complete